MTLQKLLPLTLLFLLLVAAFPAASTAQTVASAIRRRGCSTAVFSGLSKQLVEATNCLQPNTLKSLHALSNKRRLSMTDAVRAVPYLQTPAADALNRALGDARRTMSLNSAFRTLPQQLALFRWVGSCGIPAAAPPGASNHNSGLAIDISSPASWARTLRRHSFFPIGSFDPVHYDYRGTAKDIGRISVEAFQRLYNVNNPNNKLKPDGFYGPATERALLSAPAKGYARGIGSCEAIRTLKTVCVRTEVRRATVYNRIDENRQVTTHMSRGTRAQVHASVVQNNVRWFQVGVVGNSKPMGWVNGNGDVKIAPCPGKKPAANAAPTPAPTPAPTAAPTAAPAPPAAAPVAPAAGTPDLGDCVQVKSARVAIMDKINGATFLDSMSRGTVSQIHAKGISFGTMWYQVGQVGNPRPLGWVNGDGLSPAQCPGATGPPPSSRRRRRVARRRVRAQPANVAAVRAQPANVVAAAPTAAPAPLLENQDCVVTVATRANILAEMRSNARRLTTMSKGTRAQVHRRARLGGLRWLQVGVVGNRNPMGWVESSQVRVVQCQGHFKARPVLPRNCARVLPSAVFLYSDADGNSISLNTLHQGNSAQVAQSGRDANGNLWHQLQRHGSTTSLGWVPAWLMEPAPCTTAPPAAQSTGNISLRGLQLLKHFEGFEPNFYNDSVGIRTIGYGHACHANDCSRMIARRHNGSTYQVFAPLSQTEGDDLLRADLLRDYAPCVRRALRRKVNDDQLTALISLAYNIGCGGIATSTAMRRINGGASKADIAEAWGRWNKGGGRVLPGLVRRRSEEINLYFGDRIRTVPGLRSAAAGVKSHGSSRVAVDAVFIAGIVIGAVAAVGVIIGVLLLIRNKLQENRMSEPLMTTEVQV